MLAAGREKVYWVHSEGVHEIVPMQECTDADKKLLDLTRLDTDTSVDSAQTVSQGIQDEEAR